MNAATRFLKIVKTLIDQAIFATVHLDILKQIDLKHDAPHRVFKNAAVFYNFTQKSHFESAFTHITKLVDKHDDGVHIGYLLNFVESNIEMFPSMKIKSVQKQIRLDRGILSEMETVIKTIRTLRDKFYAHLDKEYLANQQKLFEDNPLTLKQMDEVVSRVAAMVNYYFGALTNETYEIGFIGQDDVTDWAKYVAKLMNAKRGNVG